MTPWAVAVAYETHLEEAPVVTDTVLDKVKSALEGSEK